MSSQIKEYPILFSAPMIRAILGNRKSQTRRVVKPQPNHIYGAKSFKMVLKDGVVQPEKCGTHSWHLPGFDLAVAPFFVGQRLWVRETFYCDDYRYPNIPEDERTDPEWRNQMLYYRADGADLCQQIPECDCSEAKGCWRPPMFMFRWASRINLELTAVRVERVQEISVKDALAEGVFNDGKYSEEKGLPYPVATYKALWNSINGKRKPGKPDVSWSANPFCWVLEFRRI